MNYLTSFSEIKSKVKKVVYKKIKFDKKGKVKHNGEISILFENKEKIKIIPEADCCSISYLVEFKEYPFTSLVNKQIKSLKETKNKQLIKKLYKNSKTIDFSDNDVNKYHLYKIKLNNKLFYFGLINSSNGYYDGWISIYHTKKKK